MNPKTVKKALKDAIQAMTDYKWLFSARPGKDNTRNRKFPFQKWGLSQILCKHRNAVQIEQNLFKAEVAQAAAALFSK